MTPTFVTDLRAARLHAAKKLEASHVVDAGQTDVPVFIQEATGGRGVDVAVEAVGSKGTLAGAMRAVRQGGTAIVIGIFEDDEIPIPANLLTGREVSLVGCRGYCWDFQDGLAMLARGAVALDALITHRLPMSQLQRAFDLLLDPTSEAIKVVIEVG
jgi:L-iditol 2-dehydrogenase